MQCNNCYYYNFDWILSHRSKTMLVKTKSYSDLAIMNWAECSWATLDTCYQNLVRNHTQTKSAGKLTHLTLWYAHVRGVSGGKIH